MSFDEEDEENCNDDIIIDIEAVAIFGGLSATPFDLSSSIHCQSHCRHAREYLDRRSGACVARMAARRYVDYKNPSVRFSRAALRRSALLPRF